MKLFLEALTLLLCTMILPPLVLIYLILFVG